MRILLICYSFPPAATPRAIRFGALAEFWASQGHQVDVICGWKPGQKRREIRDSLRVFRVGGNLSERLRRWLRRSEIGSQPAISSLEETATPANRRHRTLNWQRPVRVCHDLTWKQLYWPDSNRLWLRPAVRAARERLDSQTYDAVISVSLPFTSHLVANRVHNEMRGATWIVDSGDPFSFLDRCRPNNWRLYHRRNVAWERKVFEAAAAVSVTCEQTAVKYRESFPEIAGKIHVIPPMTVIDAEPQAEPRQVTDNDRPLRLVYTGTLYREIRNPSFLFALFAELIKSTPGRRLELHLYGLVHDCADIVEDYRRKFAGQLYVHGPVSPREARRAMRQADVLINLGNSTSYQLPSKVVDYVATGTPILNLVPIEDDSSARFLKSYPRGLTIRESGTQVSEDQLQRVERFIDSPPTIGRDELAEWIAPFSIERVSGDYLKLIADRGEGQANSADVGRAA